jgi:hypothetical protein
MERREPLMLWLEMLRISHVFVAGNSVDFLSYYLAFKSGLSLTRF